MHSILRLLCGFISLFILQSCEESTPPEKIDSAKWEKVSLPDEIKVTSIKIFNDELYVTGSGKGVNGLYKTSDGINWNIVSPAIKDSLHFGLESVAMRKNKLIILPRGDSYQQVYEIQEGGEIKAISPLVPIDPTDIEVYNGDIYIGCSEFQQYYVVRIDENENIYKIEDFHTITQENCTGRGGLFPIYITKLLSTTWEGERVLLVSERLRWRHFITNITPNGFECFSRSGLTEDDYENGTYDFIVQNDTIFAAGYGAVKYLTNGIWKIYGTPFPLFQGTEPISTCIEKVGNRVYVGTTWRGVLEYKNNEWIPLKEGLTRDEASDIYASIDFIKYFNGYLFIGYGNSKYLDQGMRGVWRYKIQ